MANSTVTLPLQVPVTLGLEKRLETFRNEVRR